MEGWDIPKSSLEFPHLFFSFSNGTTCEENFWTSADRKAADQQTKSEKREHQDAKPKKRIGEEHASATPVMESPCALFAIG